MKKDLQYSRKILGNPSKIDSLNGYFKKLNENLDLLSDMSGYLIPQWKASLNSKDYNADIEIKATKFLEEFKRPFLLESIAARNQAESITNTLEKEIGKAGLEKRMFDYENKDLKDLVLGIMNFDQPMAYETVDEIIRKYEPGYMKATSRYGRAHFFAPVKMVGNLEIKTYWFNLIVVWIVSILLYLALYYNLLRKLIDYIGNFKLNKSEL